MLYDVDPRDRDQDSREIEMPWVELGRGASHARTDDQANDDVQARERDTSSRSNDPRDPRAVFLHDVDLPRDHERELVIDGPHRYELNGDESRALATIGAFRVVPERDVSAERGGPHASSSLDLERLRDQGLVRFVSLDGRERAATLTTHGVRLLNGHRRDRESDTSQRFYAGVSRPRELTHDAQLYRAYLDAEARLRAEGAEIHRVVLDEELKREYQVWLQAENRGRADSDGRPTRSDAEIEDWARAHDLPYDDGVQFPDLRIEYERDGLARHEDLEIVTDHYRGGHAASRARAGFTCYGGAARSGGRPFDPRSAEDYL